MKAIELKIWPVSGVKGATKTCADTGFKMFGLRLCANRDNTYKQHDGELLHDGNLCKCTAAYIIEQCYLTG